MKNFILFSIFLITAFQGRAQSCAWLTPIGGGESDHFGGLATDLHGNVVVAGTMGDVYAMFFSKINSAGIPIWTKKPIENAVPRAVAVSDSGYIYIAGLYKGAPLIFDNDTLGSTDYVGAFLVKLDQNGDFIWGRTSSGASANDGSDITSLAINAQGEVYACGGFSCNSFYFENVWLQNGYPGTLLSPPHRNMFVVKFTAGGHALWGRAAGGNYYNADGVFATSLTLDATNNIYITGSYACTSLAFDSHIIHLSDSTNRSGDMFLVKYSDKGKAVWATSAGGCCGAYGNGVSTDGSGNIYVAGGSESPAITFGNYSLNNPLGTTTWYGWKYPADFLVKYSPNGKVVWANRFESSYLSCATSVKVDHQENIYVTGYAHDMNSNSNVVLAKYDPNAVLLLKKQAAGNDDHGCSVATTKTGDVYVAGNYQYYTFTIDSCSLDPIGNGDIFILKLKEQDISNTHEVPSFENRLYPNPTPGSFTMILGHAKGNARICVVNVLGKCVYSGTSSEKITKIDLTNCPKGLYFLVVEAEGQKSIKKVVVE